MAIKTITVTQAEYEKRIEEVEWRIKRDKMWEYMEKNNDRG